MTKRLLLATLLFACQRNASPPPPPPAPSGLPPAGTAPAPIKAEAAPGEPGANPHGMMGAPTANVHGAMGGMDDGANPHGQMGGAGGDTPHGAMGGAATADPSAMVVGTIEPSAALRSEVKAGDTIYLVAKPIDPTTDEPGKMPLAVDRLEATAGAVPFQLAAPATGEIVVTARVDRDGEARSRTPGDIEGSVRVKLPTKGVKLVLDKKVE